MFEKFVQKAVRRKTAVRMELGQVATLLDELHGAYKTACPEADMAELGRQLQYAFTFTCAECGEIKSVTVLMVAMTKSVQGLDPGVASSCGGHNVGNLAVGRCPGCAGAEVTVTYDPGKIQGIKAPDGAWWKFW